MTWASNRRTSPSTTSADRAMSNSREDSEVSRLNAGGAGADPDLGDAGGGGRRDARSPPGVGRGVRPHRRAAPSASSESPRRRPFGVRANFCSGRRGAGADGERPTAPDARPGGEPAPRPGRRGAPHRREHAERRNGMAGRSYHSLGARRGWPDRPGTDGRPRRSLSHSAITLTSERDGAAADGRRAALPRRGDGHATVL